MATKIVRGTPQRSLCLFELLPGLMDVRASWYRDGHGGGGWGSDGCRRVKILRLWSSQQNCQDQGRKHDAQSDNASLHFPSQVESLYYLKECGSHLKQILFNWQA
jgi:hypothetical protein